MEANVNKTVTFDEAGLLLREKMRVGEMSSWRARLTERREMEI
jgi:hypothetical protein